MNLLNLSTYLIGLVLVSFLAGSCLAAILIYFDPISSSLIIFILFYLSLFITFSSVLTLIGWFIRRLSQKRKFPLPNKEAIRRLEISFRQGMLLSIVLITVLILQSQRILSWWNLLIIVSLVALSEWWLSRR